MIEKFNKLDNSKKIPIIIITAIILITIIILVSSISNNKSKYNIVKEDINKELVYTIKSTKNGRFYVNVPYINIKDETIKSINEEIDSYIGDFINEDKVILSYEYDVNGKVLSLVIKVIDYDTDDLPIVYFKTFNINLETKGLVSDEELLNAYEVDSDEVNSTIEKQFTKWYKELIKEKYINEEECDYDCFLEYREVDDYMGDIAYYIDKGKLIVFKPFNIYSIYGEEEYFAEDDFKIIIK